MTNNPSIVFCGISIFLADFCGSVAASLFVRVVWVLRMPTDNYQARFEFISGEKRDSSF